MKPGLAFCFLFATAVSVPACTRASYQENTFESPNRGLKALVRQDLGGGPAVPEESEVFISPKNRKPQEMDLVFSGKNADVSVKWLSDSDLQIRFSGNSDTFRNVWYDQKAEDPSGAPHVTISLVPVPLQGTR